MKLVIAEKPSVAQSLAKVIGANKRQDGYLEGGGYRGLFYRPSKMLPGPESKARGRFIAGPGVSVRSSFDHDRLLFRQLHGFLLRHVYAQHAVLELCADIGLG